MTTSHPTLQDMQASGGDPRDLTTQQLATLKAYFDNSLFDFAWTFFNFRDLEGSGYRPVHLEVCNLLQLWGEPKAADSPDWHPGSRLMIQIPRGAYKSSLCTISNALWQVSRNPNRTGLICNEVLDNSKKWLRLIREVITTNRLYQAVYRDLLPPGIHWADREAGRTMPRHWKWSDFEFNLGRDTLVPECSLTAAGVGTATTGGHWDFIIKDDLISEEAKQSAALMQRARDWFDSSLPLEKPAYKGVDLVVCTPWTFDDVYRYILEKYDYVLYRRSAIEVDEHGREYPLIPKRTDGKGWSIDELRDMQRRRPFYFNAQMMCSPKAGDEQSFSPQWLRYFELDSNHRTASIVKDYYQPELSQMRTPAGKPISAPADIPLSWMSKVLLVDPASADERTTTTYNRARTAILAVGKDPWGRRYLLDGWAGKTNPTGVVDQIFRLAMLWGISRCGIEEVAFSLVYQYWLRQESAKRGYHLAAIPLKPAGRHKDDRISQLVPGFQGGFFYLRANALVSDQFRREFIDYPYASTRDMLDAMAYESEILRNPGLPNEARGLRDFDDEPTGPSRRDVTGYGQPYF